MSARLIIGDVRAALATLPDASVDLVLTSPPFLALRSYLPANHADKHLELGSEATPAEYIVSLLAVTADLRRVVAPHGSLCVELGDTYSGSGGAGGDYAEGGMREGQTTFGQHRPGAMPESKRRKDPDEPRVNRGGMGGRASMVDKAVGGHHMGGTGWPLDKSLTCIPDLYQVALAYGINPLTGAESPAGRWRVRNKRAWCRPNPPVGALGDKVRPATSYMVMACTNRERWFDLDVVRHDHIGGAHLVGSAMVNGLPRGDTGGESNPAGAPPLDWVNIPTQPYKNAHYATWPEELCVQPIEMMCPVKVCRVCGEPSRRIVETEQTETGRTTNGCKPRDRSESFAGTTYVKRTTALVTTLGWTDCGHDDYRHGVVLDPFAGSGTSLQVATRLGRDAIGIDLDPRNEDLVRERVGMFLTAVERLESVVG